MNILIVEDEKKLAQSLKEGLVKEGYAARYVTSGESALNLIEKDAAAFDIIILDLMLPGKNGFEVCTEMRNKNVVTPILILTVRDAEEDKVRALDSGADDYLVKPFSFRELLARIRALLRRPKESLQPVLQGSRLSLDQNTYTAQTDGRDIPLTKTEFRLLEYLMTHPDQALSREDIFTHVWGLDINSYSNIVDVYIKNIRKKLNDPDGDLLETVHGVGYKIKK